MGFNVSLAARAIKAAGGVARETVSVRPMETSAENVLSHLKSVTASRGMAPVQPYERGLAHVVDRLLHAQKNKWSLDHVRGATRALSDLEREVPVAHRGTFQKLMAEWDTHARWEPEVR